ncbi:NRDE family protein [Microbacterium capsulatum]|uniref:NRDE family protein n=1 Tax=Microbacterium capsulatum TaxID=3041921 RepID=A0ABU0XEJ3_9MICO|nr:NRDE family protein [Microbacterium sp. ASV81]MDQ4213486.1 hypothetical protein [Microbacterium sp. ASV81]
MCTVVIEVGEAGARLLAVRDEDPQREWDGLGAWWPDRYPGVIGIRDRRAGGAWMAALRAVAAPVGAQGPSASPRLAVLLNRADVLDLPEDRVVSRGALALESVAGRPPSAPLPMHGFNLLEVSADGARVLSWDGVELREQQVPPGVHMIAHSVLDDPETARIARWLPEFRAHPTPSEDWPEAWISLLAESAELDPADDRAIIRDNRPHGYPTQSLLYCTAEVTAVGVDVRGHTLPSPARWG